MRYSCSSIDGARNDYYAKIVTLSSGIGPPIRLPSGLPSECQVYIDVSKFVDLTDLSFFFVAYFIRANLGGASLRASLSGIKNAPVVVLVMAQVRPNGFASLINPVISNWDRA